MIITCKQCQTRFRLDDDRLPVRGARVRCSKCKHAFFVPHPSAPPEDALEDAALSTAAGAAAQADLDPEPAGRTGQDPEEKAACSGPAAGNGEAGPARGDDEGSWEFDDATGVRPSGSALPPGRDPLDEFLERRDPLGGSSTGLDDLGPPESWDFVEDDSDTGPIRDPVTDTASGVFGPAGELLRGDETGGGTGGTGPAPLDEDTAPLPILAVAEDTGGFVDPEPSGVELAEPAVAASTPPAADEQTPVAPDAGPTPAGPAPPAEAPTRARTVAPSRAGSRPRPAEQETASTPAGPESGLAEALESFARSRPSARSVAGWAATAGLLLATVVGALRPPPAVAPEVDLVGGLRAEEIRVRRVPHLSGADLLVVSGRVVNRGSGPRALGIPLEVRLLDSAGVPLEVEGAPAGIAVGEEVLREGALSGLIGAGEARARELGRQRLAPGEGARFDAVFAGVDERAARYELRPAHEETGAGEVGGSTRNATGSAGPEGRPVPARAPTS